MLLRKIKNQNFPTSGGRVRAPQNKILPCPGVLDPESLPEGLAEI